MDYLKNKKILILLDNPFTNDRRVYRIAKSLVDLGLEVRLLACKKEGCLNEENIDGIDVERIFETDIFDIKKQKSFKTYTEQILRKYKFDVVHANDQAMLNLGACLKKNRKDFILVYDSHELFHAWPLNISNFDSKWIWIKSYIVRKLLVRRELKNSNYIDYLITVNKSIEQNLRNHFTYKGLSCVIRNIPNKTNLSSENNVLREKFNLPKECKILVFIGANIYAKTLNLEQVIDEIGNKKDKALIFICAKNINSKPIIDYVKKYGYRNIYFHDLIVPDYIPHYLSSADVGLVPTWNKKDLSYWYALDNKLFEYMHSHIPILATKQPEYVNIVETHNCGICVNPDNKNAYLNGFEEILSNFSYFKVNTLNAANVLNWENEEILLHKFYKQILNA